MIELIWCKASVGRSLCFAEERGAYHAASSMMRSDTMIRPGNHIRMTIRLMQNDERSTVGDPYDTY